MKKADCKTFLVRIIMSGPISVARQVMRKECLREGLCVTIDRTDFIYTGGEERGFIIGLLNYPRFPLEERALVDRANKIADLLLEATFQHSVMVVTPDKTFWRTKRKEY